MPNLSEHLVDAVNTNVIDLLRVGAGIQRDIVRILTDLEGELVGDINRAIGRGITAPGTLRSLLAQTRETISTAYEYATGTHRRSLVAVAEATEHHFADAVNSFVHVPLVSVAFTKEQLTALARDTFVLGRPSAEWWALQSAAYRNSFVQAMRLGMLKGEDVGGLTRRVRGTREGGFTDGLTQIPTYQAQTLVRTSTISVANATRLMSFINNRDIVTGVQWVSTLDSRTTVICIGLDGSVWSLPESNDAEDYGGYTPQGHDKEFPGPTAHWGCRSTQISVLKSFNDIRGPKAWKMPDGSQADLQDLYEKKLIAKGWTPEEAKTAKMDMRASMDGQVAASPGYEGWLKGKSEPFQNRLIGNSAANLFRQGKLSLTELTDQSNRPISANQLLGQAKAGAQAAKAADIPISTEAAAKKALENLRGAILNDEVEWEAEHAKLTAIVDAKQVEADAIFKQTLANPEDEVLKAKAEKAFDEFSVAMGKRSGHGLTHEETVLARQRARLELPEHERGTLKTKLFTQDAARVGSITKGVEQFERLVSPSVYENSAAGFVATRKSRSFYSPMKGTVNMSKAAGPRTVLHELMHLLEARVPDLSRWSLELLAKRTEGMTAQRFGKGYRANERFKPAAPGFPKWLSDYMGKLYAAVPGYNQATEVLSMGIEFFYYEPARLAREDPALFDFVYRVLRGLAPL